MNTLIVQLQTNHDNTFGVVKVVKNDETKTYNLEKGCSVSSVMQEIEAVGVYAKEIHESERDMLAAMRRFDSLIETIKNPSNGQPPAGA